MSLFFLFSYSRKGMSLLFPHLNSKALLNLIFSIFVSYYVMLFNWATQLFYFIWAFLANVIWACLDSIGLNFFYFWMQPTFSCISLVDIFFNQILCNPFWSSVGKWLQILYYLINMCWTIMSSAKSFVSIMSY